MPPAGSANQVCIWRLIWPAQLREAGPNAQRTVKSGTGARREQEIWAGSDGGGGTRGNFSEREAGSGPLIGANAAASARAEGAGKFRATAVASAFFRAPLRPAILPRPRSGDQKRKI